MELQQTVNLVRDLIAGEGYVAGDRLPPERELTGRLGLGRGALRRAFDVLERDGIIWRHVGKGTFFAGNDGVTAGEITGLSDQITPVRMMQARVCIEAAISREAAKNASREAINRMNLVLDRSEAASTWREYETQDDLFHRAVAEAADNILLLALFDHLNQVRRAVAWGNVVRSSSRPPRDHPSFEQHRLIASAIQDRDPAAAHDAMRQHLGSVSARLFEET